MDYMLKISETCGGTHYNVLNYVGRPMSSRFSTQSTQSTPMHSPPFHSPQHIHQQNPCQPLAQNPQPQYFSQHPVGPRSLADEERQRCRRLGLSFFCEGGHLIQMSNIIQSKINSTKCNYFSPFWPHDFWNNLSSSPNPSRYFSR